jgi:hypothetical protein
MSCPTCHMGHRYGDAIEPWPECNPSCDPRLLQPSTTDDDPSFGEGECGCIYHAPSTFDEDGWWEPVASCPLHGDTL